MIRHPLAQLDPTPVLSSPRALHTAVYASPQTEVTQAASRALNFKYNFSQVPALEQSPLQLMKRASKRSTKDEEEKNKKKKKPLKEEDVEMVKGDDEPFNNILVAPLSPDRVERVFASVIKELPRSNPKYKGSEKPLMRSKISGSVLEQTTMDFFTNPRGGEKKTPVTDANALQYNFPGVDHFVGTEENQFPSQSKMHSGPLESRVRATTSSILGSKNQDQEAYITMAEKASIKLTGNSTKSIASRFRTDDQDLNQANIEKTIRFGVPFDISKPVKEKLKDFQKAKEGLSRGEDLVYTLPVKGEHLEEMIEKFRSRPDRRKKDEEEEDGSYED